MSLEKEIKQSKFSNPFEKTVVNILYTAKILEASIKEILVDFGVTNAQYNILRILNGSHPEPMSPGQIKEVMIFKGSDLTRLLDRMEKKSMITRILCPTNRRKMEILISDDGKAVLKAIQPRLTKLINNWGKNIDVKTANSLNEHLDQFRTNQ